MLQPPDVSTSWGCSQVNYKFEQVTSDGHPISLAGAGEGPMSDVRGSRGEGRSHA